MLCSVRVPRASPSQLVRVSLSRWWNSEVRVLDREDEESMVGKMMALSSDDATGRGPGLHARCDRRRPGRAG